MLKVFSFCWYRLTNMGGREKLFIITARRWRRQGLRQKKGFRLWRLTKGAFFSRSLSRLRLFFPPLAKIVDGNRCCSRSWNKLQEAFTLSMERKPVVICKLRKIRTTCFLSFCFSHTNRVGGPSIVACDKQKFIKLSNLLFSWGHRTKYLFFVHSRNTLRSDSSFFPRWCQISRNVKSALEIIWQRRVTSVALLERAPLS